MMIMNKYNYAIGSFVAIIPARAGSKGIPDKNIKVVAGLPLLAHSIKTALTCFVIDKVIVSTDSEEYAQIAEKFGAKVPFLRPLEISQDDSLDIEYLQYTLSMLGQYDNVPEFVVLLRPTTPFRQVSKVVEATELILHEPNASAVVSVHYLEHCPYKWMKISDNGYLQSPFDDMMPDDVNLPRQSFPRMLLPDGYVDVLRSKNILEANTVYGDSPYPYFTPDETIDIDDLSDIKLVEKMFAEKPASWEATDLKI